MMDWVVVVVESSMDRGYNITDSSVCVVRVHSMDSSVVAQVGIKERVSLSLSLTLAVHVVQTGVHVGVDRGNSHTTDNRRVDSSMDRGYSVGDSSTYSGGDSSDSGYSVGDSSDSGYSVGDSSIDGGYSVGDSSTDSGIRVHSMADSSVVEERVSLSLSLRLSLTLAVHVVQTGVHVGVDRGNSHTTDNRRVDSSMDSGYSVGDSSDSGYSVGDFSDSGYS